MLNTDDYKVLLAVLDAGSQKGLFRPADFAVIGNLHNKLEMLIKDETSVDNTSTTTATTSLKPDN